MTTKEKHSRRRLAAATAMALAAVAALAGTVAPVSAVPDSVSGKFETSFVSGDDCQKQAPVCATGTTGGKLKGQFTFGVSSVTQTADSPSTGVVLFTGTASIETREGTLRCRNAGSLQTRGDGPFASLCVVSEGTGEWTGASGYLQVHGTLDLSGGATGNYVGQIVRR